MNLPWIILAVVVAFALGAVLGEWDGGRRADQRWLAQTEKARADGLAVARTVETARFRTLETAYRVHQLETERRRVAADRAAAAVRGLRNDLAAARRNLPEPAGTPGLAAFDACRAVLGDCGERYRDMAQAADDHAADARLCVDGWPRQ